MTSDKDDRGFGREQLWGKVLIVDDDPTVRERSHGHVIPVTLDSLEDRARGADVGADAYITRARSTTSG